jgi:X-Pro dipeptidyl-peptidase
MRVALALLLLLLLWPAAALAADPTYETLTVPTVGGAQVHVEIARPAGGEKVPVILTYSPYNTLGEYNTPNLAADDLGQAYVPKGYARAVADVLGTRNSTGCWDYGGPREQQSGVDLVNVLARQPWSNGKVAMIGGSYDGTTANMVAARGADVPGLAAIVPQSAINHWYGYAYQDGVRYSGNTENPTDEGIDTPLGFDYGLARTPPTQPTDPAQISDLLSGRLNPCDSADHTAHGYDATPDYDDFWLGRDYLKDAARVRVPVLVTHGWQDYNVKQSEGTDLYEALGPRTPFKKLFMFQGAHEGAPDDPYAKLLERFFAHTLKGADNGIESAPNVLTQGRAGTEAAKDFRAESEWPPVTTGGVALALGRDAKGAGVMREGAGGAHSSYTDRGTGTEERALQDPGAEDGWLFYATPPLKSAVRLAGSAVLEAAITDSADRGQLAPTLVDVAPDGSATAISRGFMNLRYRDGLAKAAPVPAGELVRARVRLAPQDQTVAVGHRIGLIVESSNTGWAVPEQGGYEIAVRHGESRLVLPVVGAAAGPGVLPGVAAPVPGVIRAPRLTLAARHRGARRLAVSGTAPTGARVRLRVTRAGRRALTRTILVRAGRYRTTFRVRGRGRLRVRAAAVVNGRTLRASRTLRRGQPAATAP